MNAPAAPLPTRHCKIAIIGTGFSGLGMAIRLKQQGENDFLLFEKTGRVRGRAQGAGANANFVPPAEAAQIISLARAAFEQSFTGVTLAAAAILVLVALVIRAKTGRDTTPVGAIRPHH